MKVTNYTVYIQNILKYYIFLNKETSDHYKVIL